MNNIILFNHFKSSKKKDHNLKMPGLGYLKMIYSRFLLKTVLHNYFINLGRSSSCLNCHVSWTTLYLPHFDISYKSKCPSELLKIGLIFVHYNLHYDFILEFKKYAKYLMQKSYTVRTIYCTIAVSHVHCSI